MRIFYLSRVSSLNLLLISSKALFLVQLSDFHRFYPTSDLTAFSKKKSVSPKGIETTQAAKGWLVLKTITR